MGETSVDCIIGAEAPFDTRHPTMQLSALRHTCIQSASISGKQQGHICTCDGVEGHKSCEGDLLRVEVHHNGFGVVHHPVLEVAAILHIEGVPAGC